MNVAEFIDKWRRVELTERSAAQQHFLDLCELFDQPKPAKADPTGDFFTFEKGATKKDGSDGWADVWKRGDFAAPPLKPGATSEMITADAARAVDEIAVPLHERGLDAREVARFWPLFPSGRRRDMTADPLAAIDSPDLGSRFRKAREARDWTLPSSAEAAGMSPASLGAVEDGVWRVRRGRSSNLLPSRPEALARASRRGETSPGAGQRMS